MDVNSSIERCGINKAQGKSLPVLAWLLISQSCEPLKEKHLNSQTGQSLPLVVAVVHALSVDTPQKIVQVRRGNNITLPCTYRSSVVKPDVGDIVSWMKISTEIEIINKYLTDGGVYQGKGYEDRVSFSGNTDNGDISIILSQVTMDDNGTYECSVRIREDPPLTHATMELLVLVSPSKPECKIIGTTEYGQNINLTCNSIEGFPKPEYSWQNYDAQNKLRTPIGTVTPGMLMLKNISADTSGYYICLSKNSIGEDKCNITVAVTPPSMNFALYGGIIGGVVAAIIIIAILAYCCCCKEKAYKPTETEDGYRPPQQPVRIRGPTEEEIQEEEEQEGGNYNALKPSIPRLSLEVSEAAA
ncbi:cell surface A33 antigen [Rhineura floridana]|uniref:cell surface A33 antigen n=1 Tax=Rhineura floridana TaxID=261503 RepID=UPI002AC82C04|nr:cell surface A33 antigen [Rhineura floridana]